MNTTTTKKEIVDFWNRQPCNSRHSFLDNNTVEYFNEVIAKRRKVEPHNLEFLNPSEWKDKTVLEIGCGLGIDSVALCEAGANYTGIDISDYTVELAKRNLKLHNLSGNIYLCDILSKKDMKRFQQNSFDFIYSYGVIHHTLNPRKAIKVIRSLIKNTGTLKFMVYAKNSWKDIMIRQGLDQYEAQANCPNVGTWSKEDIYNYLNGYFTVTNITQTHIFPYSIPEYKRNEYKLEPWFEHMPVEMFDVLKSELGWHYLITAEPN